MTVKDILKKAAAEVGTAETGSNIVKYNDEYWGPSYRSDGASYPWCVVFLWWVFRDTGIIFPSTAHCDGVRKHAIAHNQWVTKDYRVGDCIIFDYDYDGSGDHIGIIESVNKDGSFSTIEGNYGDKVAKVKRTLEGISGAFRPAYDESSVEMNVVDKAVDDEGIYVEFTLPVLREGAIGYFVQMLQFLLNVKGFMPSNSLMTNGKFDGEFGPGTLFALKAFQTYAGIEPIGECGKETWKALLSEGNET